MKVRFWTALAVLAALVALAAAAHPPPPFTEKCPGETCVPSKWDAKAGSLEVSGSNCQRAVGSNSTVVDAPAEAFTGIPPRYSRIVIKGKAPAGYSWAAPVQVNIQPASAPVTDPATFGCVFPPPSPPPSSGRRLLSPANNNDDKKGDDKKDDGKKEDDKKDDGKKEDDKKDDGKKPACYAIRISPNCTEVGLVNVDYALVVDGSFLVHINVSGQPIAGSPFAVTVKKGDSGAIAFFEKGGSASKIVVKFDGPTNKPKLEKCSDAFDEATVTALGGAGAKCEWTKDGAAIEVKLGNKANPKSVTFKSGNGIKIKTFASEEASGTVEVAKSEDAAKEKDGNQKSEDEKKKEEEGKKKAEEDKKKEEKKKEEEQKKSGSAPRKQDDRARIEFKGAAFLTACTDKKDFRYQCEAKGLDGRLDWDVVPLGGNASAPAALAEAIAKADKKGLEMPQSLPTGQYNVSCTAINTETDVSVTRWKVVTVSSEAVLPAAVPLFTDRVFFLGQEKVYVGVEPAVPKKCGDKKLRVRVAWTVLEGTLAGPSGNAVTSFDKPVWDVTKLVVAGKQYKFEARTTIEGVQAVDTQIISISVNASAPDARIVGGSSRTIGTGNNLKVRLVRKDQKGVSIVWSCGTANATNSTGSSSDFGGACPGALVGPANKEEWEITRGAVPAGVYLISVTVTRDGESASASQQIRVVNGSVPIIFITARVPSVGGFPSNQALRVKAEVEDSEGEGNYLYYWSATASDGSAINFPFPVPTKDNRVKSLTFPPGTFANQSASGASVTIKVTVQSVSAELTVTLATPPTCSLAPDACCAITSPASAASIIPGVTPVEVTCGGWTSAAGQISYAPRALKRGRSVSDIASGSDPRNSFSLRPPTRDSSYSFKLRPGKGARQRDDSVVLFIVVTDESGAASREVITFAAPRDPTGPELAGELQASTGELQEFLNATSSGNATDTELEDNAEVVSQLVNTLNTEPSGDLERNITAATTANVTTESGLPALNTTDAGNATAPASRRRHAKAWWGSPRRRRQLRQVSSSETAAAASTALKAQTAILKGSSTLTNDLLSTASNTYATSLQSVALSVTNAALTSASDATDLLSQMATSLGSLDDTEKDRICATNTFFDQVVLGTGFLAQGAPAYRALDFNGALTSVKRVLDFYSANCAITGAAASVFPASESLISGVPSNMKAAVQRVTRTALQASGAATDSVIAASAAGSITCPGSSFRLPSLASVTGFTGDEATIVHLHLCRATYLPETRVSKSVPAGAPVAALEVRNADGSVVPVSGLTATPITIAFTSAGSGAATEKLALRSSADGGASWSEVGFAGVTRDGTTLSGTSTHLTLFAFVDLTTLSSLANFIPGALLGAAPALGPALVTLLAALAATLVTAF